MGSDSRINSSLRAVRNQVTIGFGDRSAGRVNAVENWVTPPVTYLLTAHVRLKGRESK